LLVLVLHTHKGYFHGNNIAIADPLTVPFCIATAVTVTITIAIPATFAVPFAIAVTIAVPGAIAVAVTVAITVVVAIAVARRWHDGIVEMRIDEGLWLYCIFFCSVPILWKMEGSKNHQKVMISYPSVQSRY
jgi:hypothetical protein